MTKRQRELLERMRDDCRQDGQAEWDEVAREEADALDACLKEIDRLTAALGEYEQAHRDRMTGEE